MARVMITCVLLAGPCIATAAPVASLFDADAALSSGSTTLSLTGTVTADAGFFVDSDTVDASGTVDAMPAGQVVASIDVDAATMTLHHVELDAALAGMLSDSITLFLVAIDVTVTPTAVAVSLTEAAGPIALTATAVPGLYDWGPVPLDLAVTLDFQVDTNLVGGFSDTFAGNFSPMVSGTVAVGADGLPTGYSIAFPEAIDTPVNFMTTQTIGALTADVTVTGLASISTFMLDLVGSAVETFDVDADAVYDAFDNCIAVANPSQYDSNGDGIGNLCDADVTGPGAVEDCLVNFIDLNAFRVAFFATPVSPLWNPDLDLNNDAGINFADLDIVQSSFFGPPGPSATGCN